MKGLDDEVGNEAARFLSELTGGGKNLKATAVMGQFSSAQPVQVSILFSRIHCAASVIAVMTETKWWKKSRGSYSLVY